jgi:hypothetical protein
MLTLLWTFRPPLIELHWNGTPAIGVKQTTDGWHFPACFTLILDHFEAISSAVGGYHVCFLSA